jgi:hypothetical protein
MWFTTDVLLLACSLSLVSASTFLASRSKEALLERPYKYDEIQGLTKRNLLKREPNGSKSSKNSKKSKKSKSSSSKESEKEEELIISKSFAAFSEEEIAAELSTALDLCKSGDLGKWEQCFLDAEYAAFLKVCAKEELSANKNDCMSIADEDRDAKQSKVDAAIVKAARVDALNNCNQAASDSMTTAETELRVKEYKECNLDAFLDEAEAGTKCTHHGTDSQEGDLCINAAADGAVASFYGMVDHVCVSQYDFPCIRSYVIPAGEKINVKSTKPSSFIAEVAVGNFFNWGLH